MKLEVLGEQLELDEELVDASEDEIRSQVEEFLSGERESFDLSFSVPESFTGEVMREMLKIPLGETRS